MLKRTLCFESGGELSVQNSQLVFEAYGSHEPSKTAPIEDLAFVILESQRIRITTYALDALAENNTAIIVCDKRHMPSGFLLPNTLHSVAQRIVRAQLEAPKVFLGKLWKQTVVAKIRNQAACMRSHDTETAQYLEQLSKFVKAGDPENREGTAAAVYFKTWGIVRGRQLKGTDDMPNPALNYGYALLRAAMARALVGSGLLCIRGIHHCSEYDSYVLADDIMEPYRPFVDNLVFSGEPPFDSQTMKGGFSREMKVALLGALASDVKMGARRRPLANAMSNTSASLAACFEQKETKIRYPEFCP